MTVEFREFQLLDTLPHGYCVVDSQWIVRFWNSTLERWSGKLREEFIGKSLLDLFPIFKQPRYHARVTQAIESGVPSVFSSLLHKRLMPFSIDGDHFQIHQYYLSGLVNANGERLAIFTIEDLTKTTELLEDYRTTCQKLRDEEAHAQQATLAKSSFLATMSHEIRTPLNGIIGMASLLQRCPLPEQETEYVSTIMNSSEVLLKIISDILDFSKIESGHVEIEQIEFDLRALLESVIYLYAEQVNAKKVLLSNLTDQLIPTTVVGDPTRIRQILCNYLSNAIKFTEKGEIQLRVVRNRDESGSHQLRFELVDTGPGIPDNKKDLLFKPYSQADGSISRAYGGTGLGLTIARKLAQLMGGDAGFESQVNRGSTFWFSCRVEWSPNVDYSGRPNFRDVSAKIVTDNELFYIRVRDLLALRGLTAATLVTPAEFSQFKLADACLYLLDQQAPYVAELNREEIVRFIKLESSHLIYFDYSPLKSSEPADPQCLHFHFPLRQALLYKSMERVLFPTHKSQVSHDLPGLDAKKNLALLNLRILVAEDNAVNQKVMESILRTLGHSCEIVGTGRAAINSCKIKTYDIIFMDCEMPDIDGLEATRLIRGFSDVSIIALTANASKMDRDRCLDAGMNDYLSKPLTINRLSEVLVDFQQKKTA